MLTEEFLLEYPEHRGDVLPPKENILEVKSTLDKTDDLDDIDDSDDSDDSDDLESSEETSKSISKKDLDYSVDLIEELFSDYIGIVITGYVTFKDDVFDIEKKIAPRLVSGVYSFEKSVIITLSKVDGSASGYIKIVPSITGEFSEKFSDAENGKYSRYRINFYGGESIEYSDKNNLGQIYYFSGAFIK